MKSGAGVPDFFSQLPRRLTAPPLVSLGLVALCGTPDDFALQNLLVVIKKGTGDARNHS